MDVLFKIMTFILIATPNLYYQPALETGNGAIIIACIVLQIAFMCSVKYLFEEAKAFFNRKPTR